MEEYKEEQEDQDSQEETGNWLKDNLRIIISIIIVVAIAGGIYSYSKRTSEMGSQEEEKIALEEETSEGIDIQTGETEKSEVTTGKTEKSATTQKDNKTQPETENISQETEKSFVETAVRGNGSTHLARRALADYLEKNPDSGLTAEHKIYIEDYLRKKSGFRGRVHVGTSIEFSKELIKEAIDSSKHLNERQLNNLKKYSVRVPSLS